MPQVRSIVLVLLAMLAFAGNSLLCRLALDHTRIDPASFTAIRLFSGAVMLGLVVALRAATPVGAGNWLSAVALFAYAAGFSFAYVSLSAATGALVLFASVQITMISHGLWTGERLRGRQVSGLLVAFAGLVGLLLPGLSAPPIQGAVLMLGAGLAWGIYSLRGKNAEDPARVTAGNFLRTVPIAFGLGLLMLKHISFDVAGVGYAIASGALTSGIGYAIWYAALPALKASTAAVVQLSVPLLTALGGVVFLAEPVTWRLALASVAVLGGTALVLMRAESRLSNEVD